MTKSGSEAAEAASAAVKVNIEVAYAPKKKKQVEKKHPLCWQKIIREKR
jgi:hypothetical protein